MKHIFEFEEFINEIYSQSDFPMQFNDGQIKYWQSIINTDRNKFKHLQRILDTIKALDNKVTWTQYQVLKRAAGGNITKYSNKN